MPNNNQEIVITSFFDNPYDINNKTLSYEIPVGGAYIISELTQVNSDWLAIDGLSAILNKPILADVATSGDYDDLYNKPILSDVVSVNGQTGDVVLTAADVGADTVGSALAVTAALQPQINTKASQADLDTLSSNVISNTQTLLNKADIATLTTLAQLVDTKADQSYVINEIARITGNAPAALDTLAEIAEQLGNDQTQINNLLDQIGKRVRFDAAQALTIAQQTQARDNINAEAKGVAQSLVSSVTTTSIGAATMAQGTKADTALQSADVAPVALSGSYNDLTNKPTIPVLPTLATVATSGSYTDLTNKPDLTLKQNSLPTTGTAGQFLAHDLTFKTPASGSTVNEYSSTALASAWTGTNPSVLALTVTGLLATHKTVLDVDLSSVTFANIDGVQADYALIYRAVPTANTLTLYASKKPTKDLSLKLVVLNG